MGGNWTPATFGGEAGRFGDVSTRKTKRNEHGDSLSPGFAHICHLAICLLDESATGKGGINDAVCPHEKRAFSGGQGKRGEPASMEKAGWAERRVFHGGHDPFGFEKKR